MNELDLDKFGEIMDDFLKKNEIRMLITLPEGSIEPVVEDNVDLGSTVHFYILSADAEGYGHRQKIGGMGQCGSRAAENGGSGAFGGGVNDAI